MLRRLVLIVLLAAVFLPLPQAHAAPRPAADSALGQIITLVNVHRAAARLQPLTLNRTLMSEAQRFSAVQASIGRLSHRGVDGTTAGQRLTRAGYNWSFYGENLAAGQETAAAVVAGWMASPGHRAVMLSPKAYEVGIGHTYRSNDPARFYDYWVMELGRPR